MKELFLEVAEFFEAAGGSYATIDDATYTDLLESLVDKRLIIIRDESGNILSVSNIWLIKESDLPSVSAGVKPFDVSSGDIVYIADHAGTNQYRVLINHLQRNYSVACWHHRYKSPEAFRIYRRGTSHAPPQ